MPFKGTALTLTFRSCYLTLFGSWHLVPANNKRHARLTVLKTAAKQIEAALGIE